MKPNTTLKMILKSQGKREKDEEMNRKELQNCLKTMNKMAIRTYITSITLNVSGLNGLIKR